MISSINSADGTVKYNKPVKKAKDNSPVDVMATDSVEFTGTAVSHKSPKKTSHKSQNKDITSKESTPPAAQKEKEVTFLFYLNGQWKDHMEFCAASTMLGLESVGSDDNVNIVARVGREKQKNLHSDGWKDKLDGDWAGIRQYYVTKNPDVKTPKLYYSAIVEGEDARSQNHLGIFEAYPAGYYNNNFQKALDRQIINGRLKEEYVAEHNFISPHEKISKSNDKSSVKEMSDPKCLETFIADGMSKYPAKHYCLVMTGHGGPWMEAAAMPAKEIRESVEKGVKEADKKTGKHNHLDAIVFNSCSIASFETANELKNSADFIVASEQTVDMIICADWAPVLNKVEKEIKKNDEFNPKKFASDFVDYYKNLQGTYYYNGHPTISAIDSKGVKKLAKEWKNFINDWKETNTPDHIIFKSISKAPEILHDDEKQYYCANATKDFGMAVKNILKNSKTPDKLKKDCEKILDTLDKTVINIANEPEAKGLTGLSIWAPTDSGHVEIDRDEYKEGVPMFEETGWPQKIYECRERTDQKKIGEFVNAKFFIYYANRDLNKNSLNDSEHKKVAEEVKKLDNKIADLRDELSFTHKSNYVNK